MRYNPWASTDPGFRNIYVVAPKTLIPSLRGDAVVTDTRREPCNDGQNFVNESDSLAKFGLGDTGVSTS